MKHKKTLLFGFLLVVLLSIITGCTNNTEIDINDDLQLKTNDTIDNHSNEVLNESEKITINKTTELDEEKINLSAIIEECDSLCREDEEAYCTQERTIELDGVKILGTCRAFAKKGNVEGFNRCPGFCSSYDKSGTTCNVNGSLDSNCDGIVD